MHSPTNLLVLCCLLHHHFQTSTSVRHGRVEPSPSTLHTYSHGRYNIYDGESTCPAVAEHAVRVYERTLERRLLEGETMDESIKEAVGELIDQFLDREDDGSKVPMYLSVYNYVMAISLTYNDEEGLVIPGNQTIPPVVYQSGQAITTYSFPIPASSPIRGQTSDGSGVNVALLLNPSTLTTLRGPCSSQHITNEEVILQISPLFEPEQQLGYARVECVEVNRKSNEGEMIEVAIDNVNKMGESIGSDGKLLLKLTIQKSPHGHKTQMQHFLRALTSVKSRPNVNLKIQMTGKAEKEPTQHDNLKVSALISDTNSDYCDQTQYVNINVSAWGLSSPEIITTKVCVGGCPETFAEYVFRRLRVAMPGDRRCCVPIESEDIDVYHDGLKRWIALPGGRITTCGCKK